MTRFFLLLLALRLVHASAASISGIVLDPSLKPVPGAVIECGGAHVSTGPDGRFIIPDRSECDATVTAGGFAPASTRLSPGRENRVQLTIAASTERVVVSATRTFATLEESGVSATVFTRDQLRERAYPPVADILREAPGLNVASSGGRGAITSLFTRGAPSTATLVLLDGAPLNDPGGQIDIANLTTAGIERIEIVRGPESALFGAEAAAGVVQMFSTRGDPESARPHGMLSYERGSFATDRWSANLNGGIRNRADYSFSADQLHTSGMFANNYYRNTTGTVNAGVRLSNSTEARAIFREYDSIAGNPNAVEFGVFDSDANGENRDSTLIARVDDIRGARYAQRVQFTYHRLRSRFNDAVVDGPYTVAALVRKVNAPEPRVYLVRQVSPDLPASEVQAGLELVVSETTLFPFPSVNITDREGLEYQGTWSHRGGALVFGYDGERQAGVISARNVSRRNHGGFIHEQATIGRLFLTGGARIEHSSTFGNKYAPRGSAAVKLAGDHGPLSSVYLRFSAGRGITEPSLLENFAHESFFEGNLSLKPEKLTNYELGVVQEWFGRRVRAELTAFRNSFDDLIVFDSSRLPSTWNNIDRSWARGLETFVTARPWSFVAVNVAYTHMRTRITRTNSLNPYSGVGEELPRRPRNFGSASILIAPGRWTLLVGGRFTGERQDSDFVFGVTRNPGYGNLYASASWQATKNVAPFFRADNLLDDRYSEVLGYPALSRNAIGGVRVTW